MQELEVYVEAFLKKFKKHNGYSEVSEEIMKQSILCYFKETYDKEIAVVTRVIENEAAVGRVIDKKEQEKLMTYIAVILNKRFTILSFMGDKNKKAPDSKEPYTS